MQNLHTGVKERDEYDWWVGNVIRLENFMHVFTCACMLRVNYITCIINSMHVFSNNASLYYDIVLYTIASLHIWCGLGGGGGSSIFHQKTSLT